PPRPRGGGGGGGGGPPGGRAGPADPPRGGGGGVAPSSGPRPPPAARHPPPRAPPHPAAPPHTPPPLPAAARAQTRTARARAAGPARVAAHRPDVIEGGLYLIVRQRLSERGHHPIEAAHRSASMSDRKPVRVGLARREVAVGEIRHRRREDQSALAEAAAVAAVAGRARGFVDLRVALQLAGSRERDQGGEESTSELDAHDGGPAVRVIRRIVFWTRGRRRYLFSVCAKKRQSRFVHCDVLQPKYSG